LERAVGKCYRYFRNNEASYCVEMVQVFSRWDSRVVDDSQSQRPRNAITDMNTDQAEQLLKENRRLPLRNVLQLKHVVEKG
jgi:hypothetical protein